MSKDQNARVTFVGNPWKKGHAATLSLALDDAEGQMLLSVELKTVEYNSEEDVPDKEGPSDWETPGIWKNYSGATFSGEFALSGLDEVKTLADLDGEMCEVDQDQLDGQIDYDSLAFEHCFILGHDTIAGHTFFFTKKGKKLNVEWRGKVAMSYDIDDEFKHEFIVKGAVKLD